ncbi:MAG: glycosyltransferase family 4 protein [Eubacterium sp.]|nr:glycosyltransferase family 4 protein [Eubacterium sp.]
MIKVLISYLFCSRGGVETALLNRLHAVDKKAYRIDLHFFRDEGGLEMFKGWKGHIYTVSSEKSVKKLILRNQYDLVITIDSLTVLRMLEQVGYKGKIGLEIHTTYKESLRYLSDRRLEMVDFIIVPSVYQKKLIRNRVQKKHIIVVGNAVNPEICYQPQCILPAQKKILLWVGRIDEHKNWRLFLQIADYLHRSTDCFLFWVAGGLKSDVRDIQEFEKYLYQLDLERHVFWIPQADYKNMGILYSYAANSGGCYISTSRNESFGMTVIEAMKCRCPVIVNAVGAFPEIVGTARGLCLEDMWKVEQMERIREFLMEEDTGRIVSQAESYVREEFSCESVAEKFCSILNKYKDKN